MAIDEGGDIVARHPVVVEGYSASLTSPSSSITVDEGDSVDVTVDVSELPESDNDLNYVQAVLADDSDEETTRLGTDTGKLDGSLSTDSLDPGDYELYVTVRGNDNREGQDEILGFSDPVTVTIEASSTPTDTPTSTSTSTENGGGGGGGAPLGGGGGGGGAPLPPGTPADSTTDTPADSATDTGTETGSDASTPTDPSGKVTAEVTTTRIDDATVEAQVSTNGASETTSGSVATIDADVTSESGAFSTDTVTIESGSTADYSASVSVQDGAPPDAPGESAAGTVSVGHTIANREITQTSFTVTVDRDRLSEQQLAADELALYRQHDDEWTRLDTETLVATDAAVTVEAISPGLSEFVLGNSSARAPVIAETTINETNPLQGTTVGIGVTVENGNDTAQQYALNFSVGGVVTTRTVEVGANRTQSFTYPVRYRVGGGAPTEDVYVNGVYAGTIEVRNASAGGSTPTESTATTTAGPETATDQSSPTATDRSVITPRSQPTPTSTATEAATTATGGSGPGFTVPAVLTVAAMLAALALLGLRHRQRE
ncbi:MAG: hypothetical protein ABEH56_07070 [Salinirussus sp.]